MPRKRSASALFFCFALCAWGQTAKLAGTWLRTAGAETFRLELKPDGNATLNGLPLRWTYSNGRLTLITPDGGQRPAAVEVSDTALTLTPGTGERMTFQREGTATTTATGCRGLVGSWRSPDAVITMGADGTTVIAGVKYQYTSDGKTLTLTGADGTFRFPYELSGNTLLVNMNGRSVTLTCVTASGASSGPNPPELVGKWCALSNFNTYNGGRMSSSCIVLNADGTYEYNGETSSSEPVASQVTQEWDRGTWSATETSITANSRTRGTTVYSLEKRNHPKNKRDPMIVLNGQPFVTYGPKAPW